MLFKVPDAASLCGLPATVTRPFFNGVLKLAVTAPLVMKLPAVLLKHFDNIAHSCWHDTTSCQNSLYRNIQKAIVPHELKVRGAF
jgi:hypothetical protein